MVSRQYLIGAYGAILLCAMSLGLQKKLSKISG
jgi:hypothetical protein